MSTTGIGSSARLTVPRSSTADAAASGPEETVLKQLQEDALKAAEQPRDSVDVGTQLVSTNLSAFAQQVLDKLNEIVGKEIPGGLTNLAPEDHTPEKTAQRIVDGVTALLPIFAAQHKELSGDALISAFMETIRGGIEQGYGDAEKVLGDVGAFDITGVRDGIDETKKLVEEKLKAFETSYRKQLSPGAEAASSGGDASAADSPATGGIDTTA